MSDGKPNMDLKTTKMSRMTNQHNEHPKMRICGTLVLYDLYMDRERPVSRS